MAEMGIPESEEQAKKFQTRDQFNDWWNQQDGGMQGQFHNLHGAVNARFNAEDIAKKNKEDLDQQNAIKDQQTAQRSQFEDNSRQGLAQSMAGIRKSSSNRGLLYSGLRQGAEQGAKAEQGAQSAQNQSQVNQWGDQAMSNWRQNRTDTGLNQTIQAGQQKMNDYNSAMGQYKQKKDMFGSIGSAIGNAAGALI